INQKNQVIGIVTMKSSNENLNFALPVAEVENFPENSAEIKLELVYQLPILGDYKKKKDFIYKVVLPLNFKVLNREIVNAFKIWTSETIEEIRSQLRNKLFPYGEGSITGIYNIYDASFPLIFAVSDENSEWNPYRPSARPIRLENGVSVQGGEIANLAMARLSSYNLIAVEELWNNPDFVIENIFTVANFVRDFANEKIRIIKPGKFAKSENFKDFYGREWQMVSWNFEYSDQVLIAIIHKTPDGVFIMYQIDSKSSVSIGVEQDYKFMADFFYLAYKGNFEQWDMFLKDESTPAVLKETKLQYDGEKVELKNKKFNLTESSGNWFWDEFSILEITLGYQLKDDKPVWEIRNINLEDSSEQPLFLSMTCYLPSSASAPPMYNKNYNQIINNEKPYDGQIMQNQSRKYRYTWLHKQDELFAIYCSFPKSIKDDEIIKTSTDITTQMRGFELVKEIPPKEEEPEPTTVELSKPESNRPWADLLIKPRR
ncbi:MAG: hypothetical protein JXR63_03350, partial [Spirochaetales bacterium]|nr:hypothetical protein [Spirochaetales bacterium]